MFGRIVRKVGVMANNQNSSYHHLHRTISEYTRNIKEANTTVFYGDIHNRLFTECLENNGFSNNDIRYMYAHNRRVRK